MASETTMLKLGPDDAGMRLTAEEFANADFQIVDRFKHLVLVLTWQEHEYAERVLRPGETYTTPLLPGLAVAIRDVFA